MAFFSASWQLYEWFRQIARQSCICWQLSQAKAFSRRTSWVIIGSFRHLHSRFFRSQCCEVLCLFLLGPSWKFEWMSIPLVSVAGWYPVSDSVAGDCNKNTKSCVRRSSFLLANSWGFCWGLGIIFQQFLVDAQVGHHSTSRWLGWKVSTGWL